MWWHSAIANGFMMSKCIPSFIDLNEINIFYIEIDSFKKGHCNIFPDEQPPYNGFCPNKERIDIKQICLSLGLSYYNKMDLKLSKY